MSRPVTVGIDVGGTKILAAVLDPEGDGRNEPVGIDRKFVMAGLLIAGTVLCLILVVFDGGRATLDSRMGSTGAGPLGAACRPALRPVSVDPYACVVA